MSKKKAFAEGDKVFVKGDRRPYVIDGFTIGGRLILTPTHAPTYRLTIDKDQVSLANNNYMRRWHAPGAKASTRVKKYITCDELRQLITKQLAGKFDQTFQLYLADERYYLPPLKDVKEIVAASTLDRKTWVEERFDCDDFAVVLKGHFAEAAYAEGKRRAAHAMGVVWGIFEEPHAINWVVTSDKKLRFIEPQTDEVFFPRPKDSGVWFMMG